MEWPDLIVEELLRCGVEKFFIAPGSRSTPLVSAIARNEKASVLIHYDERGTAFAALGYARSTGRPAAWITTSGTAVANGLPAVVEASVDGVPMILLTADRPADLRDTGANQTILQSNIFGGYVRWKFEFPVPETQFDPAFVLTTIDQAVYRSIAENGPVHLNCMFRKPLELSEDPDAVPLPSHLLDWGNSDAPYTTYALSARIVSEAVVEKLRTLFGSAQRPVILLGRVLDSTYEKNIVDWAREEGIPVLPDISSSFRVREQNLHSPRRSSPGSSESEMNHSFSPVIPYWELLMSVEEARNDLQPDLIVQFGRGIVSTRFETAEADRVVIDSAPDRFDPGHQVILRIQADARGVNDLIGSLGGAISAPGTWLSAWQAGN